VAEALPGTAAAAVGAPGTVTGVTAFETPTGPLPMTFLASTLKV